MSLNKIIKNPKDINNLYTFTCSLLSRDNISRTFLNWKKDIALILFPDEDIKGNEIIKYLLIFSKNQLDINFKKKKSNICQKIFKIKLMLNNNRYFIESLQIIYFSNSVFNFSKIF